MRLILTLEALADMVYDEKYYHKLQGLIYSCLKDTKFSKLHDIKTYKYFCYSNIFPVKDFKTGDEAKFIISSPNSIFIETLKDQISKKEEIHIGEMSFLIKNIKTYDIKISKNITLINSTPIIIRIKPQKAKEYGITRKHKEIFWRKGDPIEIFIKQLEENIIKKYNLYYNTKFDENLQIFEIYKLNKSIINYLIINGFERKVFGSFWMFKCFNLHINKNIKNIIKFAIDTGFGERNTYGFGFINIKKEGDKNVIRNN